MRLSRRSLLLAGLSLGAGLGDASAQPAQVPDALAVSARPILAFQPSDPARARFGSMLFRSGLVLTSPSREFGGFSGLWRSPDGSSLVAITDRAHWLTGRLTYDSGKLLGLADAALEPMLNGAGRPLHRTRSFDTEALCIDGGVAYVGIERTHEIVRFDWARRGAMSRAATAPTPQELKRLPSNRGIEALGLAPPASPVAGALVALAERSGGEGEPTAGFIIGGARPGALQYLRADGYDVTDLAFLPDGDMLVLERWYKPWRGVGMRIRRVPGASVVPGAVLHGPVLMEADLAHEIDNMEGLTVHVDRGRTILTLVSDDNFSGLQRTVLLEFELIA